MNKPLRRRDLSPYQPLVSRVRIRSIDKFVIDPNLVASQDVSSMFDAVGSLTINDKDIRTAEEALRRLSNRADNSEASWIDRVSLDFSKIRG